MLLFLNLDCLFADAADDIEPHATPAMASLASALQSWPALRLVIASEHRYRMTLAQLRALFPAALQHHVIATTLIYGGLSVQAWQSREAEILDWLAHADAQDDEWLALDNRVDDYGRHAGRLVACRQFTPDAAVDLQTRLLLLATPRDAWSTAPQHGAEAAYRLAPAGAGFAPELRAEALWQDTGARPGA